MSEFDRPTMFPKPTPEPARKAKTSKASKPTPGERIACNHHAIDIDTLRDCPQGEDSDADYGRLLARAIDAAIRRAFLAGFDARVMRDTRRIYKAAAKYGVKLP